MSIKEEVTAYLRFNRKERMGFLLLLFAIGTLYVLPHFLTRPPGPGPVPVPSLLAEALDSLRSPGPRRENRQPHSFGPGYAAKEPAYTPGERFRFDPNTLPEDGWRRLGLGSKPVATILRYRAKGGRFYKPDDLQRIWGLPPRFFEDVKHLVTIEAAERKAPDFPSFRREPRPARVIGPVELNGADSTALIALPGIGSRLAARILAFRDRLGGFYSVDQVAETFGLADSVFGKIRLLLKVEGAVKKISINTATKEELKNHPYIRWKLANAIVEYRNQHGSFSTPEALKNIALLDEASYRKLLPYLAL